MPEPLQSERKIQTMNMTFFRSAKGTARRSSTEN
jgi:hypothetical protein